ncbi:PTS sugar transporter subunit IIB [Lactiplantibacillus plantarum]|uniref:PTS sugar transporter subunit IIB n=1 Tax=Lactiplantibacillus plantarum TaxID=1590 RepID=UPI0008FD52C9|nr:PTS sugar transporter subunit IIB [Lactiplantibacillus plantarum]APD02205.1 PTS galactitol transporter subunit IIB [Lactiplantibacillus plantarum]
MAKRARIIVACGSGVATSTLASQDVISVAEEYGVDYTLNKCSMVQLPSMSQTADLVLTTNNYKGDLDTPHMSVMGFVTGIGKDKLRQTLGDKLVEIANS